MSDLTAFSALTAVKDYLTSQDIQFTDADPVAYDRDPSIERGIEFAVVNGSAALWAEQDANRLDLQITDYISPLHAECGVDEYVAADKIVEQLTDYVDRGLIPAA